MKVLLTLGRLPKALDIARALASAGCEVIVAEPFEWHLTRLSTSVARCVRVPAPNDDEQAFQQALLGLIEREGVELVVPVSDETMHVGALHELLPPSVRLFSPPQHALLALHDKLEFIRVAQRAGLCVPRTCDSADADAARELLSATRCISKPRYSSAGKGLLDHPQGSQPPTLGDGVPRVVQEYLPGDELSTFGVARHGELVANVVYRGVIMSGTVAVSFERLVQAPQGLDTWVREFARATQHDGFLSFDFRLDRTGRALPMECNPRATSGIHFLTPSALAQLILEPPAIVGEDGLRTQTRLQQFYPALTEVQAAALRGHGVENGLRLLFRTRDVTWHVRDPLPLLLQPIASIGILWRTILKGWTFGEAATFDIAWGE